MTVRSFSVALALAVTASGARGQQCVLMNEGPVLRGAAISIAMIADESPNALQRDKPAIFRRALLSLYDAGASPTMANRYLLGRLYAVWIVVNLPGTKAITTREDLALRGGDPKSIHDVYLAIDSAFATVEAANPTCADSTGRYRRAVAQMAFNDARLQLAAQKVDSAVVLAKRALVVDPGNAGALRLIADATRQRRDTVSSALIVSDAAFASAGWFATRQTCTRTPPSVRAAR